MRTSPAIGWATSFRPRRGAATVSPTSASLRGLYTEQSVIEGHYNGPHNHSSPPDLQFNYGGRFWDIGFGVNTVVPGGPLKGLRLSAEGSNPSWTIPTAISSSVRERSGPTPPCRSNPSMNGVRRCEPADAVQFFWTMQAPPSERSSAQSFVASARLSAPICTI